MEFPSLETFSEQVATRFVMHYGDGGVAQLELLSATDLGSTSRQNQFSLIFQGPDSCPARQGVYRMDHEKLGTLDIFLVPIAKDKNGLQYEAVINRFIE